MKLRTVHIFKDLTGSLLSIGMLCDAGFTVTFEKKIVSVKLKGTTVISGRRINKLWMIDVNEEGSNKQASDIVQEPIEKEKMAQMIANTTHADIVKYAHLTMG